MESAMDNSGVQTRWSGVFVLGERPRTILRPPGGCNWHPVCA